GVCRHLRRRDCHDRRLNNTAIKLAPPILAADFAQLGAQVAEAERCSADRIHVDVMDGHLCRTFPSAPWSSSRCGTTQRRGRHWTRSFPITSAAMYRLVDLYADQTIMSNKLPSDSFAHTLATGDLTALFLPGRGMLGASFRHRGEEILRR